MKAIPILLLLIALATALPADFPTTCVNSTTINGYNFTWSTNGQNCSVSAPVGIMVGYFPYNVTVVGGPTILEVTGNPIGLLELDGDSVETAVLNFVNLKFNSSFTQNFTFTASIINSHDTGCLTRLNATFTNSSGQSVFFDACNGVVGNCCNITNKTGSVSYDGSCIMVSNSTNNISVCDGTLNYTVVADGYCNSCTYDSNGLYNYITPSFPSPYVSQYTDAPATANGSYGLNLNIFFNSALSNYIIRTDAFANAYRTAYNTTNNTYQAYVLYSSYLVQPLLVYYPGHTVLPEFGNATLGTTYLYVNEAAYIIDKTNHLCFFVAPYAPTNTSTIQTMTAVECSAASTYYVSNPTVFLTRNCWNDGTTYYADIRSVSSRSYIVQRTYANATSYLDNYSTAHLQINFSSANLTNFSIVSGTESVCAWNNQTKILFNMDTSVVSNTLVKIVMTLFTLAMVVVSSFVPFAALIAISLNDAFTLLSAEQMFAAISISLVLSFANNYAGDRTLKSLGIYVAMAVTILIKLMTVSNYTTDQTQLESLITSFNTLTSSTDIGSFILSLPTFLLTVFATFLLLPAVLSDVLFNAIYYISPMAYSAFVPFKIVLTTGLYLWLVLKAYEVISNRFRAI